MTEKIGYKLMPERLPDLPPLPAPARQRMAGRRSPERPLAADPGAAIRAAVEDRWTGCARERRAVPEGRR